MSKAPPRTPNFQRKRTGKSAIMTDTPEKQTLEEEVKLEEIKIKENY